MFNWQTFDGIGQPFFQFIQRRERPDSQLVFRLQRLSAQPDIHRVPDLGIRSHHIPGIATARQPVAVMLIAKGEMSAWKRPQRSQIPDAVQLLFQRAIYAIHQIGYRPWNKQPCGTNQLLHTLRPRDGDALRILERHSEFKSGQLTAIRRQRKAEYRRAVELAAQKNTDEAFAQLERMGTVVELSDRQLHASASQSYLKAMAQNQSVLLVAPTWAEIEAVTEKVRAALKSSGRLALDEKEFSVFDSLSWTEAQKRDTRQYRPDMAIHFHRRTAGFAKDETVTVVAIENDALKVQHADGSENLFQLGAGCACFDVGEKRKLKIAVGDKLLLQANASRKRFINGELVEVLAIQGDSVVLADGRVIPQNYHTFTHGYAVTSHAAQGKTADEVLVVASSRSLPAINQQQFYVSISRGRDACRVFTDDAEMLRSHVTRSSARLAAVEVVPRVSSRKFIQTILQRGHRFLKQFRLRRVPRQTILPDNAGRQIEPPCYEHKRTSTNRISI